MKLNDLYKLAKAVEDTLPEIAKENDGQNVRSNIQLTITVTEKELHEIDRELYLQVNNDLYGYKESDEIAVDIFGITFTVVKTEPSNG